MPVSSRTQDIQTLFYFVALFIVGIQLLFFAFYTKIYAMKNKMLPVKTKFDKKLLSFKFEIILIIGALLALIGLILLIVNLVGWGSQSFGELDVRGATRMTIMSVTALIAGIQLMFGSFFIGILQIDLEK